MSFRATCIFLLSVSLSACSTLQSDDPASLGFSIPDNSGLALTRSIDIGHNATHATIQFGEVVNDRDRQDYDLSCRLDFSNLGPRTIEPETYRITRTEDGSHWISENTIMRHYTEVYLSSDSSDVIKMVCQQYGSQIDNHFSVADMQDTLGDLVRIEFSQQEPASTE